MYRKHRKQTNNTPNKNIRQTDSQTSTKKVNVKAILVYVYEHQYLKSCNAVWVVSSVHRAVNDKTARDLLGEHFRRQLLMDGQYGSVSFICSKTDILNPSEIIRFLISV